MLNDRLGAARKVATSLFDAERDIDAAVSRAASLIVTMLDARQEARLPAVIGQEALDNLGEAVTSLIASRRQIVKAHQGLDVARGQIGLGAVAFGDQFPKPSVGQADAEPGLRVVA